MLSFNHLLVGHEEFLSLVFLPNEIVDHKCLTCCPLLVVLQCEAEMRMQSQRLECTQDELDKAQDELKDVQCKLSEVEKIADEHERSDTHVRKHSCA